ncbi:MAG: SulP family inorganic anion transporter [Deltaproteobacteria bacterium]|nr:SulP family inorganic anion transporter [Deltaproteobacteria bacterium]MBW2017284.1 SulP family inorganic anion transporter [Deltaproteobacteria bacterium]MBW2129732.1 SulP family inorganic anion transporter [Deltaproteobacteria bacterium]MBW2304335.1 SulP family inorganic anion transporter [Deltaproteobacteria bacterium]
MITRIFPFLGWFKDYGLDSFRLDALSGLTVALVLIPQSMAYAQLAGLPPYYGLYASFLPPMVAALFGSSLQLATGPVAVVSLMTSASLAPIATQGSAGYITYAILLALMVGLFQFTLGLLRLGLVVNFLSHPVVNGFTNAAALIIASSQFSKLFGVHVDNAEHHYETIFNVFREALHYTHWPTLIMGISAFVIMYGLKRIAPKIPNVLVAVVVTTVISWATGFEHNRVVDISSLEFPQARGMIKAFNDKLDDLDTFAEQRTEISKALDEASKHHDMVEVLNTEHALTVITFNIGRLNSEIRSLRAALRRMLFHGVEQPDGSIKFYPKGQLPAGVKGDGRIWHLKVGNKPLNPDKLLMIGGGEVVGVIPKGLPSFSLPEIDPKAMAHLLPFAAIISLLGFMEAISIAKAMAAKTGQRLDPNQELIGQGLANILGSVAKSYPTSGSFSRSAVNLQSGAVTGLSSVFTSLAVVIVLFFFTPLLYHLPQAVLASVIMMAVIGLVNVSGFIHAWEAKWYDGAISIITFIATLAFAPHLDKGIMVGVVLSLLVFLYKSMRPTVATLARYEDQSLRDCATFGLKECEYISMIRFDGPLFFANASYLEDEITERMRLRPNLKHIILVSNGINDIDASGEETLSLLVDRVRSAGLDISMSGVNETVLTVLRRTHFIERIGEDHIYPTMEKAINGIYADTHRDSQEEVCPLMTVCRIE